MERTGLHSIDGKDLWTVFGIVVQEGSNDFLKFPARKESITHDWRDSNGLDVDLSRIFFEQKPISLKCVMIAENEADFWAKHKGFLAEWAKPDTRAFHVGEFKQTFYVYYDNCTGFDRFTRIKNSTKVVCEFTLNLFEKEPTLSSDDVFIVDEDGRFLIT
jgi:hypothetical protein